MTAHPVLAVPAPSVEAAATLIFNVGAGGSAHSTPEALVEALHQIGYRPVYRATDSEADLHLALDDVTGPVFVAGGDGTVRAAALYLAGRPDVTLGIIPLGTANNVARTLGIAGDPLEVISSYAGAQAVPFDLGRLTAPWGHDVFLEALGCGLFAEVLAAYDPEQGKSPLRAAGALGAVMRKFTPAPLTLTLDGEVQPPLDSLLLEVMNTPATGPRLPLCSGADPGDGLLNVVWVDAGEGEGLLTYVAALAAGDFAQLPSVTSKPVRSIEIPYYGQPFHVDGEVRPAQPDTYGVVRAEVWEAALQVLVPIGGAP
ncbi:diacylglycerol/lipid kinase family protein [Deinococcus humi]|uniref:Diacylglycerol kinase family enzyme n=1 Tax=Deinococcus humi TaxID=662880 RepID=A0A7W8JYF3_9DEIO|nr:diacylglycerol kinase family protein [Deinococcus humi]MBB5365093.1 diacylglycerol kinase family enzyme [Deinococcus humi]GGO39568.1 diacylglycerol kinase [Deinococcus humi]